MSGTADGWMGGRVGDDRGPCRYQNFFSFDFFGFSALRFIVAVITTLTFALAPGLMPLSEIPVCSVDAAELDPRSE
jgi:hypothetical protein